MALECSVGFFGEAMLKIYLALRYRRFVLHYTAKVEANFFSCVKDCVLHDDHDHTVAVLRKQNLKMTEDGKENATTSITRQVARNANRTKTLTTRRPRKRTRPDAPLYFFIVRERHS